MPYNIQDLSKEKVANSTKYFFDANVWLYVLDPAFRMSKTDEDYISFFEAVAKHNNNTKIVMSSFLISEVINRYLRDIGMKKYAREQGDVMYDPKTAQLHPLPGSYFKKKYRPSSQFSIDYERICDELKAFHSCIEFVSDEFNQFRVKDILKKPNAKLDFNDSLAVRISQKNGYVIVTDDSDFWVENVLVLTKNKELLQKMSANRPI